MPLARSVGQFSAFVLLGMVACVLVFPSYTPLRVLLVLAAPLVLVFVVPAAARTILQETSRLLSSFTWWHGLWMIVWLSGVVFRIREVQDIEANPVDGWAFFRIALESFVGLALLGRAFSGRTPWLRSMFRGIPGIMTSFLLLCMLSMTWSVKPAWTLYKSLEYSVDLAMLIAVVVTIASLEEYEKFFNWTWTLLGVLLVTAWVGAVLDPVDALERGYEFGPLGARLRGVMPNLSANAIGDSAAILSMVALCRLLQNFDGKYDRKWYRLMFAASFVTLIFSQTRSALGGLVFGVLILLVLGRRVVLSITLAIAGTVVLALTNAGQLTAEYLMRGQSVQQAESLTGRLEWWQFAWQKFLEHPWTGYGAFAGGRFVVLESLGLSATPDLHSSVVETLVGTGFLGVFLLFLAVAACWWYLLRAVRSPAMNVFDKRQTIEVLAVFSVISVRCVLSSNMIDHPALPFLTVVGFAELVRRRLTFVG
jgi:O-antigen ligase